MNTDYTDYTDYTDRATALEQVYLLLYPRNCSLSVSSVSKFFLGAQWAVQPPSTGMIVPVVDAAASPAR